MLDLGQPEDDDLAETPLNQYLKASTVLENRKGSIEAVKDMERKVAERKSFGRLKNDTSSDENGLQDMILQLNQGAKRPAVSFNGKLP